MSQERRRYNPKLSGSGSRWASFRGWSLLFDNPAARDANSGAALERLESADGSPGHELYDHLDDWVRSYEFPLGAEHDFVALPRSTYHVTVADGLSAPEVQRIRADGLRARWSHLLEELPSSLVEIASFLGLQEQPWVGLIEAARPSVAFRLASVELRGHAIVVGLEPFEHEDRSRVEHMEAARAVALRELSHVTGLELVKPWCPHLTLGYLSHLESADDVRVLLDAASDALVDVHPATPVRFESMSLYGFTSMRDFWRMARLR